MTDVQVDTGRINNSFAHGGTTYSLMHDAASIEKAMRVNTEKAADILKDLLPLADVDVLGRERLIKLASKLSGLGTRAINQSIKDAQAAHDGGGKVPPLSAAINLLKHRPDWEGLLTYDDFTLQVMVNHPIPGFEYRGGTFPRRLTEAPDITDTTYWLQTVGKVNIDDHSTIRAIKNVALDTRYHPVRQYLNGLAWDGVGRLDTWLHKHCGAEDNEINRAYGAKWLISAVARIMQPGCLVKTVLTLECTQDFGKSSILHTLAVKPEWFLDNMGALSTKDALLQTVGKWIVEHAEFDNLSRHEASEVKAFLSTRRDTYRAPYGIKAEDHPRQWVAAATINPGSDGYLVDVTGNVRFWTVACGVAWNDKDRIADIAALAEERDQMWAEAVHRYRADEPWWLDTKELRNAQNEAAEDRTQSDTREEEVRELLDEWETPHITMGQVLLLFGIESKDPNIRRHQTAFGTMIKRAGWKSWRRYGVGTYYFPPESGTDGAGWWKKIESKEAQKMWDEKKASRKKEKQKAGAERRERMAAVNAALDRRARSEKF